MDPGSQTLVMLSLQGLLPDVAGLLGPACVTLNPKPLDPKPLNPKPLNPKLCAGVVSDQSSDKGQRNINHTSAKSPTDRSIASISKHIVTTGILSCPSSTPFQATLSLRAHTLSKHGGASTCFSCSGT